VKDITAENLLNEGSMAGVQVDSSERYLVTPGDIAFVSKLRNRIATETTKPLEGVNTHRTAGTFCRKGLSPQGEPCVHIIEDCSQPCFIACTQVAASREALLGKERLQMLSFRIFRVFRGYTAFFRSITTPLLSRFEYVSVCGLFREKL
jgi:hypothetical protein